MKISIPEILELLEGRYGEQHPSWPTDPYLFLVWWHCGYPASDTTCSKGWQSLQKAVGMVPEPRAVRLKEIAMRIQNEFGGDLKRSLSGTALQISKTLKKFPNIADPGADRIMLFSAIAPIAAVPSNCPHVLVRIQKGLERENYGVTYKEAQQMLQERLRKTLLHAHAPSCCSNIMARSCASAPSPSASFAL